MDILKADIISKFMQKYWVAQVLRILSVAIGVLGILYFFWKNLFIRWEDVDFKVLWLSGHLWLEGISPYSSRFIEMGYQVFDKFNGHPFYYPPHFRFVSSFFALFDYETGIELWRCANIIFFLLSSVLLKSAMAASGVKISWGQILFYTGLVGFMQAVILIFHIGQTTLLIYFGICLTIFGALKGNNLALIAGFCIVLLKPQIGVPLMVAFLPFKEYQKPLLLTCLVMIFLSLPGTQPIGLLETITAYLNGVSVHGDFYSNLAKMTTGVRNITYLLFGYEPSSSIIAIVTILIVLIASYYTKLKLSTETGFAQVDVLSIILILTITLIAVFAPLHTYDFVFLAPVFLLSWRFGYPMKAYMFAAFLIIVRHDNITRETGFLYRQGEELVGSELVTLAAIAMLIIVLLYIKSSIRISPENKS